MCKDYYIETDERLLFKQVTESFDSFLSKYQCNLTKGYNAQHCFATVLENMKSVLENR